MRELLLPTDTRLNLRSAELTRDEIKSQAVQRLMEDMVELATGERDEQHPELPSMVGLAAPQIGELARIIVIDTAADPGVPNFAPDLRVFANPRIVHASENEVLGREGCYSTGEICGAVYRADEVTIEAVDQAGQEVEYKSANQFQARIIQHEIDHLDGIRFPSRVRSKYHLHRVPAEKFQAYREEWEDWMVAYPYDEWLQIYSGDQRKR